MICGDKGFIFSYLKERLTEKVITLITNTRKNMKPKVMKLWDHLFLKNKLLLK
ncbi:hypothetical protein BTN49_2411 [Candidatus Enterovibrio escicola]|uniref:Transposase DDE domain-containing protein n=1 Tax=Candidatus Enterovibrio escicola TaxID=1927127 RepID=A0A2A5T1C0_9GAMM|nr:hypothetical protein BTN49_2411 [Candidatus Enterovibrio escacola]